MPNNNFINEISAGTKAKHKLEQTESFSYLKLTAGALAHELKTPLTSIKMNIDMLDDDSSMTDNKRKSLAILKKEINRLGKIVDTFLNVSRNDELQLSRINLYELIGEISMLLKPDLSARKIVFRNTIGQINLMADRDKLTSVFVNLFSNAAEAIGEKGVIEVSSLLNEANKTFSIFVKDTGSGIKDSKKIFEPFFTTKENGNGFGLFLSSEIIKKHNGSLCLLSTKSGETVFEISFPL